MASIGDLSELIDLLTGGGAGAPEQLWCTKLPTVSAGTAAVAPVTGRMTSLWQYDGSPSFGAAPGAARYPTNATQGALKQADPGGGRQKWLVGAALAQGLGFGSWMLYDRIADISGLDATNIAAQAAALVPTRYTDGAGVQAFIEIYTQIGATATTAVFNYVNQDGNPAVSPSFAIGGTGLREAQRLIPVPLAAGDSGVRESVSVDLLASTTTAGDFGVTLARPLLTLPLAASGAGIVRDLLSGVPGPAEVLTDACLAFAYLAGNTSIPSGYGSLSMVEV